MKVFPSLFLLLLLLLLSNCQPQTDSKKLADEIEFQFNSGNFNDMSMLADSLKEYCQEEHHLIRKADSLVEISERICIDFSLSLEEVRARLNDYNIEVNESNLSEWEKKNWLECRIINGEKRYFGRTASNLKLLKLFHETPDKRKDIFSKDDDLKFRKDHTSEVIKNSNGDLKPAEPVEMLIDYTLTIRADAVPEGETLRCWLPWPKENHIRQQNVKLISVSHDGYKIAPDSCVHRSVYLETMTKKGEPTVFHISFSYRSYAQYFKLHSLEVLPYRKNSEVYLKYTSEQLPQINFSDRIRRLADSITEPDD